MVVLLATTCAISIAVAALYLASVRPTNEMKPVQTAQTRALPAPAGKKGQKEEIKIPKGVIPNVEELLKSLQKVEEIQNRQ